MATYEELHGKRVEVFTADPTLDSSYEGQVWFNSTEGVNKTVIPNIEAWSSGANLGTARAVSGAFGASQTAAVIVGGQTPGSNYFSNVEHYDGTGFSSATAYPASGYNGSGAGSQTAGLIAGGFFPGTSRVNTAYEYDGSSWTSTNNLPGAMDNMAGCGTGTQSNVIFSVGRTPSTGNSGTNQSVTYDGTNFGSGPNINTARMFNINAGAGTGTAALICGGFIDPSPNSMTNSEEYDGSSWSNGGTLNRSVGFSAAWGIQTNAVAQVGSPSNAGAEKYDGTSWTNLPDIGAAASNTSASAGATGDAGFITCLSPNRNQTAEFNKSINTITAAAWSSGGNLNLGRHNNGNSGTKAAGLTFGGKVYPNQFKNESEEYNGTSWSEGDNLGTARMIAGAGTQTAGLGFGGTNGAPGSTGVQALTEEYDGSSWSENGDMSTARMGLGGAGLQDAAYAAGGIGSPNSLNDLHEQYNGSSWSTATAMNTERSNMGSVGTTTASLVFGGYIPPSYAFATSSEEWNGSAWTSGGNLVTARADIGGFGSQTDAIGFAGTTPPNSPSVLAEGYDGTTFSTRPSMAQGRTQFAPSGSYNSGSDGMAAGGSNAGNPVYTNTEEWSVETTSITASTLTTS